MAPKPRPVIERVLDHLRWEGDCLVYDGHRNKAGYGLASVPDSSRARGFRDVRAHRVVYEFLVGPIPAGLHVLHSCDNPPCCNPEHLRVGDNAENVSDKVERGRHIWKTHCAQGHEYTPENTYFIPSGGRDCRVCRAARLAKFQERHGRTRGNRVPGDGARYKRLSENE